MRTCRLATNSRYPALPDTPHLPLSVVLVDDDEAVLDAVRFSLELDGIVVHAFSDGSDLLARPDVARHACLVLDYAMPGLDGLELLSALRARGVESPAVIITADPTASIRDRAASQGAPLIQKPMLNGLECRVRELLGQGG